MSAISRSGAWTRRLVSGSTAIGSALAIALTSGGCGAEDAEFDTVRPGGSGVANVVIRRGTFQGTWPFTVKRGLLSCEGRRSFGAVTFKVGGTVYAVNGVAKQKGYASLRPIWKKDPDVPGARVSVKDVIERGLKLCRQ